MNALNSENKILGMHLSPRAKGSSWRLLDEFRMGVAEAGASMEILSVAGLKIDGCHGCGACEKDGLCIIDNDDMGVFYQAWEKVTSIVVATPIFFYDLPAQGKAVVDRSQAFWSRRYRLGQYKDGRLGTRGFLLAVGATRGKDLFYAPTLSVKYFFDALGFPKKFSVLGFRQIEEPDSLSSEQLSETRSAGFNFAQDLAN